MNWLDATVLILAAFFLLMGVWKGFLKMILRFGALAASVVTAKIFGSTLGSLILPALIKSDSSIGERLSVDTLQKLNGSIATVVGTLLLFLVLYLLLRLLARAISKAAKKSDGVGAVDRILGAALGLVFALGAIYTLAFGVHLAAMLGSLFDFSDIYDAVDSSLLFKYFF